MIRYYAREPPAAHKIKLIDIERVADHINRVSDKFLEIFDSIDKPSLASLVEALEASGAVFIRSVNCLQSGSLLEANKTIHEARKTITSCEELMKKLVNSNTSVKIVGAIIMILDSIKRVAEYGIGIAELAFNLHVAG